MSAQGEIRKGDIGTRFILELSDNGEIVDIGPATLLEIVLRSKRAAKTKRYPAVLSSDGSDGLMEYITTGADILNEIGEWEIQGYVEMPAGKWHTDIRTFHVHRNL